MHYNDWHVSEIKDKIVNKLETEIIQDQQNLPKPTQLKSWFSELYMLGISLILSIIGALSFFCFCYVLIKHKQVYSLVSAGLLTKVREGYAMTKSTTPPAPKCTGDFQLENILIQGACSVAIALTIYILYYLLNKLHNYYNLARTPRMNPEILVGYPTVKLLLEIRSGTERLVLTMATINGLVHEIKLIGEVKVRVIGFRGNLISGGNLGINYGDSRTARLQISNLVCPLPDTVQIPTSKVWTVRRLSQSRYATRLLLLDEYGLAHKLVDESMQEAYPPHDTQRLM